MRIPLSTYRLQLTSSFTLTDAAELADYLHRLGADWFYLSPILAATPGSQHGYDVVDHARLDESRGGEAGLAALAEAARERGLGILVDIVPNHVGVADRPASLWWWDVLTHGRASAYTEYFDIDWDFGGGRIRIPVLGEDSAEAASAGSLRVQDGELRYWDHRFPLAPGTADDGASAETVHERQHYELVHWRRADAELNYRRFFAVNELAAIRVELPAVFDDSHVEIARWFREGLVDGLRVDHPDGLADPGGYLDQLAGTIGGAYVLVEKILEGGEELPSFWATAGTTGYDALAEIDRVLVDPAGRLALDRLDAGLRRDGGAPWSELIHGTKRAIADGILRSEVLRLVRDYRAEAPLVGEAEPKPLTDAELVDAFAELLACFPVYRSYLPFGAGHLDEAFAQATDRRPELSPALTRVHAAVANPATAVAIRFQQTSGMVMAKGVEDTAFYRVSRLATLTEVGADPDEFSLDAEEFHVRQQARLATLPHSMTTLSTHDTKRGEDTRARISVISEVPDEWTAFIARRRARHGLGDGALENLLWESIVGSWPREREALHGYAEKAAREAASSTSWTEPNEPFETRLHALVDAVFDEEDVADDVEATAALLREAGWSNSLAAKLIQLTAPGVPDVYQGSELWETSLVDPDNRRPVDFTLRRELLARLDAGELPEVGAAGAAKLLVTSRALRLRRDRPELFDRYAPVPVVGEAARHVLAFDRGGAVTVATRLPLGLVRLGGWRATELLLPSTPVTDVITGYEFPGGPTRLAELLERYPVALLVPSGSDGGSSDTGGGES